MPKGGWAKAARGNLSGGRCACCALGGTQRQAVALCIVFAAAVFCTPYCFC